MTPCPHLSNKQETLLFITMTGAYSVIIKQQTNKSYKNRTHDTFIDIPEKESDKK
jgi:hypothetical protein